MFRFKNKKEKVKIISDESLPCECGGAPETLVYRADFGPLWISYNTTGEEEVAVICFNSVYEFKHGYPNDEGFHPLCIEGLGSLGFYLIENSPWIDQIVQDQSYDKRKAEGWHKDLKHWIYRFKEITLEVVAESYEVVGTYSNAGSTKDVLFKCIDS